MVNERMRRTAPGECLLPLHHVKSQRENNLREFRGPLSGFPLPTFGLQLGRAPFSLGENRTSLSPRREPALMVKADIVKRLAETLSMKDKDALFVVDAIVDSMKELIVRDQRLEIRDFGVFQVKERKPRIGRNPKNKVAYPIPPHKVVTFKAGKDLRGLSNVTEDESDDDE